MVLADYKFYAEEFKGIMPRDSFDQVIVPASAFVNWMTCGRAEKKIIEAVKLATCAVCNVFESNQKQCENSGRHGEVKSENNDGYSISYVTSQKDGETPDEVLHRKAYQAAYMYLSCTGLLYRGYY